MRTGLLVLFSISCIYSVEHDSICDDEDSCPEPTHTVIRLAKRDDKLARQLAEEHGMLVRVRSIFRVFTHPVPVLRSSFDLAFRIVLRK
ncbi:unnamed protein product [Cylicostephanus goldi]|uniref:Peptidase S8 pro-domain domain-containing protein n=1 Tax=Cylicostephanus goldi TaxID=71465 RepID=A0A3P6SEC2_CYLGO|nr:unnamed protein product [Cylicostephanus goldi]